MLLICWCCWCADAAYDADLLMLLMRWCCKYCCWTNTADAADNADKLIRLMLLILLMCLCYWCCWFGLSDFSLYCDHSQQSHHSIYVQVVVEDRCVLKKWVRIVIGRYGYKSSFGANKFIQIVLFLTRFQRWPWWHSWVWLEGQWDSFQASPS